MPELTKQGADPELVKNRVLARLKTLRYSRERCAIVERCKVEYREDKLVVTANYSDARYHGHFLVSDLGAMVDLPVELRIVEAP
jgi:hypothetical protein